MSEESCESKYDETPIPWDTEASCKINGIEVPTRLESAPDEEYDGTLFDKYCPCLDRDIPKKKDKFIDNCPVALPKVPQVLLKDKKFNSVDTPGIPTSEIPKALLSRLLSCSLKGRTAGFDLDIERDLYSSGNPVEIDPDEALIPISIQFGDRGMLKLGIDVRAESCFCDEECGDEDYIKLKFSAGAKYVPTPIEGEGDEPPHQDIEAPAPMVTIDEKDLTQLFFTTKPAGSLAQIVAYEPAMPSELGLQSFSKISDAKYYYCSTENWHASPSRNIGTVGNKAVNRWKYKVRLLQYDAASSPEPVVGNEDPSATDMVFPAFNLNEYNANSLMLPSGLPAGFSGMSTYYSIMAGVKSKNGSRALPCPVGSLVYIIDTTPLERCKSEEVKDCEDCIPPLLFYKQNASVPLKKAASLAKFVRFSEQVGWITVRCSELDSGALSAKAFEDVEEDNSDPCAVRKNGEFQVRLPIELLQKYKV